jgi:hypothetical protein
VDLRVKTLFPVGVFEHPGRGCASPTSCES